MEISRQPLRSGWKAQNIQFIFAKGLAHRLSREDIYSLGVIYKVYKSVAVVQFQLKDPQHPIAEQTRDLGTHP